MIYKELGVKEERRSTVPGTRDSAEGLLEINLRVALSAFLRTFCFTQVITEAFLGGRFNFLYKKLLLLFDKSFCRTRRCYVVNELKVFVSVRHQRIFL